MDLVEILNKQNEYTGEIKKRNELADGEYRNLIHLWIIDDEGKILIQKRASAKKHYPNKWSITSGCVNSKESFVETCIREAKEELNVEIDINNLEYEMTFKKNPVIVNVFVLRQDVDIRNVVLQEEEVSDIKFKNFLFNTFLSLFGVYVITFILESSSFKNMPSFFSSTSVMS